LNLDSENHTRLIHSLADPVIWPEGVGPDQVIETHISTVLLVGDYAYKIKKPLNLGFLDFSTLSRRRHFCLEEVRLNGRLAPSIYIDVIPITGSFEKPQPFGEGEAIAYAVRMRRFDQSGLLSDHPELLTNEQVDGLAEQLVSFHAEVKVAGSETAFGRPEVVVLPMRENFEQIRALTDQLPLLDKLEDLASWTKQQAEHLSPVLLERKTMGFIRECHGDLHLGNIALNKGELLIFDGIEFNPSLRWIDVISELAFLLMDLDEKGLHGSAQRLLNRYLELSGDYAAVTLLRFYQVYRAMVRAKVTAIRLNQEGLDENVQTQLKVEFHNYLELAGTYTQSQAVGIIITHGFSGSGKSTQAQLVLQAFPAIRIRSDSERRRIAGLAPTQSSQSDTGGGIYQADFTARTYGRLKALAALIVRAGWVAIVDATFLREADRKLFCKLAEELDVPFLILDLKVAENCLRDRIRQRQQQGQDASEATLKVLDAQLEAAHPLTLEELKTALVVENDHLPIERILARLKGRAFPADS